MDTKLIRGKWDLSQKEFAEIIGCPIRTVQGWDSRKTLSEWMHSCLDARMKELFNWYCDDKEYGDSNDVKKMKFKEWLEIFVRERN